VPVGQFGDALAGDQDVVRLDVAVDDAVFVGVRQAFGDLEDDLGGALGFEGPGAVDDVAHAEPVHVLHGEEVESGILSDGQAAHDVLVLELDGRLGLAEEAGEEGALAGQLEGEHLDGHALFIGPQGHPDAAHAALAELADDGVVAQFLPVQVARLVLELLGQALVHQVLEDGAIPDGNLGALLEFLRLQAEAVLPLLGSEDLPGDGQAEEAFFLRGDHGILSCGPRASRQAERPRPAPRHLPVLCRRGQPPGMSVRRRGDRF